MGEALLLKDCIIQATFAENRCLETPPKRISLGIFEREHDFLLSRTTIALVSVSFAFVSSGKQLLIWNSILDYGVPNHERRTIDPAYLLSPLKGVDVEGIPKLFRQERHLGLISAASKDSFVQESWLGLVLANDDNPGAATAFSIYDGLQREIFFRSKDSPQLEDDELDRKIRLWNSNLQKRYDLLMASDLSEYKKTELAIKSQRGLRRQIVITITCFTTKIQRKKR